MEQRKEEERRDVARKAIKEIRELLFPNPSPLEPEALLQEYQIQAGRAGMDPELTEEERHWWLKLIRTSRAKTYVTFCKLRELRLPLSSGPDVCMLTSGHVDKSEHETPK
jgi:hypothetical protein